MKNLAKTLKQIEDVLNTRENYELEYWDYKFIEEDDKFVLYTYDGEFIEDSFELIETDADVETIIRSIINIIYEEEINYRQKFVNGEKAFNKRKIKSLALWISKENAEKIEQINKELVDYRSTCNKYKMDIDTYRRYVSDLYNALNVLCPTWKINEIYDYFIEQNYFDEVTISENGLSVQFGNKVAGVIVDSYSKKEDVFKYLKEKVAE